MIQKILFFTYTLFFSLLAFAQKTVDIPLEKGEALLDFVNLESQGFIIKTGKEKNYTKDLSWQLSYYSPELDLIWKVPVETTQIDKGLGQDIIVTPSGSYAYHLENKGYNSFWGASSFQVTQINKSGQAKVFELAKETVEKIEGAGEVRLCDEEYFYLVTLKKGDKNTATQLFLNRFSHKDFTFSKLKVELPVIAADKSTSAWEYAGHNNEHIWLVSKILSSKTEAYQCQIIAVDWQGNISKKVVLNTQVADLYLRPSLNYNHSPGSQLMRDATMKVSVNANHPSGMAQANYSLGTDAWASVLVDESSGIIYTYGLYGKKKLLGRASYVDGFYLTAYDMQGKQLWQQVSKENDLLLEDKYFQKRLLLHQRTTLACFTENGTVRLQIGSVKNIFTYEFSKEGKKLDAYGNAFDEAVSFNSFFLCFSPKVPAQKYYQTNASKKKSYYGSTSAKGSVLVEHEEKNKVSLLQW